MKYLLIGGHADGRRVELRDQHLPTQVAVPLRANLEVGHPIAIDHFYRRVEFSTSKPDRPVIVFVHSSVADGAVIDRLLERYPDEQA